MYRALYFATLIWMWCTPKAYCQQTDAIGQYTAHMQAHPGFFNFYWDSNTSKIWLEIDKFDYEFLYIGSLPQGVGSNDIGLDRGQFARGRIVKFVRSGSKVLLWQPNYSYRATQATDAERKAVEEAFAKSVLWGFEVKAQANGRVLVDATDFFLQDIRGVSEQLKRTGQGNYQLDKSRSAFYLPNTKNFPKNTEVEVILTFTGQPKGREIRTVVPSPEAVTVHQRHSFVQLPEAGYQPLPFDPRAGFFDISFYDFSQPIDQPLVQRYIVRHRLKKKHPRRKRSAPVTPIVYYVDSGTPEPFKSALMEGASWWNEAFEAAGYKNAFIVKELPPEADPMDVRYNLIQWVPRSTRGWSYGRTIVDPRTGEIIKGHVTLGALRVRQDYLIAQGWIAAYRQGTQPDPRLEAFALARLRQLAAHEVGHTLGLAHNFAASVNHRASVMDYPHPLIQLKDSWIDLSQAYDTGIGEWDKRAIMYGYADFDAKTDATTARAQILAQTLTQGLLFMSDADARLQASAHPYAHLWDNGSDPVAELHRLMKARAHALAHFGPHHIAPGMPLFELERILAPLYYSCRYQIEAVSKLIGGVNYSYAMRGDGQLVAHPLPASWQAQAVAALRQTLLPEFLILPDTLLHQLPPPPLGYQRDREAMPTHAQPLFDPLTAAEASLHHTLSLVLQPARLQRVLIQQMQGLYGDQMGIQMVLDSLHIAPTTYPDKSMQGALARAAERVYTIELIRTAADKEASHQVKSVLYDRLHALQATFAQRLKATHIPPFLRMHTQYVHSLIEAFFDDPTTFQLPPLPPMPPGAPIGCE